MPKTGIVIPAHNEEELIDGCLQCLSDFQIKEDVIVVVDANSQDQTAAVAQSFGVHVIQSQSTERGFAIAEGIKCVQNTHPDCEYVIIAHADMFFPVHSCAVFNDALKIYPNAVWGSFGNRIIPSSMGYNIIAFGNNIRARFFRFPYGDQAQFFRMDLLKEIGFPYQDSLEDLEMCMRLKQERRYLYLNHPVQILDRHWKELGIIRTTLRNWKTVWQYRKNRNNPNFKYNGD